jgi:type II secretory ATPase GspE/PulE/Tfp pilus assembly ATPase PilB-like protein
MVGEIRDVDTAQHGGAGRAHGHLVFSTLHTRNAAGAVTRLVELGVEPFLLSSVLRGVVAQRLIRASARAARSRARSTPTRSPRSALKVPVERRERLVRALGRRAASTARRPDCTDAPACSRCSTSASACAR